MTQRYVADTTAIISFFGDAFGGEHDRVSSRAHNVIRRALQDPSDVRLSIPSIVFVEIFDKWFGDEERAARIYYQVFRRIDDCPNVEIRSLDEEVIQRLLSLRDDEINLDNHDKIVLASAATLECTLITSDSKLVRYNRKYRLLPDILS